MKAMKSLVLVLSLAASLAVQAATTTTSPVAAPAALAVDPVSLRTSVLEGSLTIYDQLKSLEDAKSQVDIARANMYPSLNIGLSSLVNPVSFLLNTVQFLFPFLVPANHFALDQAQATFQADMISYKVMELNTYSTALALYYTMLSDKKVQAIYQTEADDLEQIYQVQEQQNAIFGNVPPETIAQAQANADLAAATASQYAAKVEGEIASLRQALGLPLSTKITLTDTTMPASPAETQGIQDVTNQVLKVAPEAQQINYVIQAAQENVKTKQWGFINSGSASSAASSAGGISTFSLGIGLNFSFGIFPQISLAQNSVEEAQLQLTSLQQQDTALMETTIENIAEVQNQLALNTQSYNDLQGVYDIKNQNYANGVGTILDVLTAHSELTQAAVGIEVAKMSLNVLRVTMHRSLLTNQFALIQGCKAVPQDLSGIKGIFAHHDNNRDITEVCREGGYNPYQKN